MKFQDHVIAWLLEDDNPPVQYLTLTRLLHQPESHPDVQQSRARLMEYAVTQGILAHGDKFWEDFEGAYRKYTGLYWQVIFLGQFLADGNEARIAKGVQELLNRRLWITKTGGQCLTANLLAAFRRLGYGEHPIVRAETEALARRIVADGGITCSVMEYSLLEQCYMALPKLLLCFGDIPSEERSTGVNAAIDLIVRHLIANGVYIYVPGTRKEWQQVLERQPKAAALPKGQTVKAWLAEQRTAFLAAHGLGTRTPKHGWLKFGFPLHYNSDILEAMYALARVNTPLTPALHKPLQIIREKMTTEGAWRLENSLNGKMWCDVEHLNAPSKWLTYFARYVLNHFEEVGSDGI